MFVCNIALVKLPLNIFSDNVYPEGHIRPAPTPGPLSSADTWRGDECRAS